MRATITKRFTFEASHFLPNHDGQCSQMHGHSYKVEVTCAGRVQQYGPKEGMVVDFSELKSIWNAALKPYLDHRHLNDSLLEAPNGSIVKPTTAENIAAWICSSFHKAGAPVISVEVWETETGSARVNVSEVWSL